MRYTTSGTGFFVFSPLKLATGISASMALSISSLYLRTSGSSPVIGNGVCVYVHVRASTHMCVHHKFTRHWEIKNFSYLEIF